MKCADKPRRLILPALAAVTAAALSACGQQPERKTDPQAFIEEDSTRLPKGTNALDDRILETVTAALPSGGQQPEKETDPQAFMKAEGIRLTQGMGELAASEEYLQYFGVPSIFEGETQDMGARDYSVPEAVYTMDITGDWFPGLEEMDLSPEIAGEIHGRLNAVSCAGRINGAQGAEILAAASMLTCRKDYLEPDQWPGDTLLILKYGGGYSSLISFMTSGEGIIEANASFVKSGEEDVLDQLSMYLAVDSARFKKMD